MLGSEYFTYKIKNLNILKFSIKNINTLCIVFVANIFMNMLFKQVFYHDFETKI